MQPHNDLHVVQATPAEYGLALQLIFQQLDPQLREAQILDHLREASQGNLSLDGILVVKQQDVLLGATWCHVLPGKTAALWFPRLKNGHNGTAIETLMRAVDSYLAATDVQILQCLTVTDAGKEAENLLASGFCRVAELVYMVSTIDQFSAVSTDGSLSYQTYSPSQCRRMAKIVQKTYRESLDCPAMDGVRSVADVLDGYRATGEFDPRRWLFLRYQSRDVGCMLLADHPQNDQWELVYLGLLPEARGKGWGLEATRHAQWLVHQAGRARLVLAVDAANHPAINVYAAAGFAAWDCRSVFIKTYGRRDLQ